MKCCIVVVEGEPCKTDMFYINAIYKKIVLVGADCVGSVAGPRGEGVRTGSDRIWIGIRCNGDVFLSVAFCIFYSEDKGAGRVTPGHINLGLGAVIPLIEYDWPGDE